MESSLSSASMRVVALGGGAWLPAMMRYWTRLAPATIPVSWTLEQAEIPAIKIKSGVRYSCC